MPAKSKAQVRWAMAAARRGEITKKQAAHYKPSKAAYKRLPARKSKK